MKEKSTFGLEVRPIDKVCAAGEKYGRRARKEGLTPVFSCEGGCIKGEIARQAANLVAKNDKYARACHGELFTVPHSDLAGWIKTAEKVVVIDGCSLFCHGRIAENILGKDQLVIFNALSIHGKYADLMDVDDVPEARRKLAAKEVADKVVANLENGIPCSSEQTNSCDCGCNSKTENTCPA